MFRRVAKSVTASETAPLEGLVSVTRFEMTMMIMKMMKMMMTLMTSMMMTRMLFLGQIMTFTFYPA